MQAFADSSVVKEIGSMCSDPLVSLFCTGNWKEDHHGSASGWSHNATLYLEQGTIHKNSFLVTHKLRNSNAGAGLRVVFRSKTAANSAPDGQARLMRSRCD